MTSMPADIDSNPADEDPDRWDRWFEVYAKAYDAPEAPLAPCPDCGRPGLRLVFLVYDLATRVGSASMWCPDCMVGISICRCEAPAGAAVLLFDEPAAKDIPNFRVLPAQV